MAGVYYPQGVQKRRTQNVHPVVRRQKPPLRPSNGRLVAGSRLRKRRTCGGGHGTHRLVVHTVWSHKIIQSSAIIPLNQGFDKGYFWTALRDLTAGGLCGKLRRIPWRKQLHPWRAECWLSSRGLSSRLRRIETRLRRSESCAAAKPPSHPPSI